MTNKENHFKLWGEIARTGRLKDKVFGHLFGKKRVKNMCFACEEAIYRDEVVRRDGYMGAPNCVHCPIVWPNEPYDGTTDQDKHETSGAFYCERHGSPYVVADDYEQCIALRKQAAAKMLELPWMD